MTVVVERPSTLELLTVEEFEAWGEYLETTRALEPMFGYDEVEPWAWNRLGQQLRRINERRERLMEPARRTDAAEGSSPAAGPGAAE